MESLGERGSAPPLAVVTGASSGLGATFARHLAARGYDLVLVARRRDRLAEVADGLRSAHGVAVRVLPADLSDPQRVEGLAQEIADAAHLRLLVHSAGFGVEGPLVATDVSRQLEMIQVHVAAATRLTAAALPGMVARGAGGVILVASLCALAPLPGFAVYGATKAYLVALCRSLAIELEGTGVHVQALCPGFTHTEFQEAQGADLSIVPRFLWMEPDPVVRASLNALGRRVVCVPGLANRIVARLAGPLGGPVQRATCRRWGWHAGSRVRQEPS